MEQEVALDYDTLFSALKVLGSPGVCVATKA
jgi:hypothetical protein